MVRSESAIPVPNGFSNRGDVRHYHSQEPVYIGLVRKAQTLAGPKLKKVGIGGFFGESCQVLY